MDTILFDFNEKKKLVGDILHVYLGFPHMHPGSLSRSTNALPRPSLTTRTMWANDNPQKSMKKCIYEADVDLDRTHEIVTTKPGFNHIATEISKWKYRIVALSTFMLVVRGNLENCDTDFLIQ